MLSDILAFGKCQFVQMEMLVSMSNCGVMHSGATCKQFMGGLDWLTVGCLGKMALFCHSQMVTSGTLLQEVSHVLCAVDLVLEFIMRKVTQCFRSLAHFPTS